MTTLGKAVAAVACGAILACGPSEPSSPLILGGDDTDVARGPRTLTGSQERALRDVVASAGEACDGVEGNYLRERSVEGQFETWDVRCADAAYSLHIFADGTAPGVQRCLWSGERCSDPFSGWRAGQGPDRRAPSEQLNPELGKLLEQMSSKDGKAD